MPLGANGGGGGGGGAGTGGAGTEAFISRSVLTFGFVEMSLESDSSLSFNSASIFRESLSK